MAEKRKEGFPKEALRELREDVDRRIGSLRARVDDIHAIGKKAVLERRILNLGAAFVLGLALGAALTRSGRHRAQSTPSVLQP